MTDNPFQISDSTGRRFDICGDCCFKDFTEFMGQKIIEQKNKN
jgi:hypothetical protein